MMVDCKIWDLEKKKYHLDLIDANYAVGGGAVNIFLMINVRVAPIMTVMANFRHTSWTYRGPGVIWECAQRSR